jgi:hypothetical protein
MFEVMRLALRGHVPGVVRTLKYRGEFFGDQWSKLAQQVLRGPSEWTVGERELFAAFVSKVNACDF